MSTAAPTAPKTQYDDPEYAANLRRATLASSVGSALEYFDFALYGLMTALVFNRLFFDPADPAMGVIGAFAVYGVGFVARPLAIPSLGKPGCQRAEDHP